MEPFDNVNLSAARMTQEETAQADFEQRLREPQPILPTSASPGAGSTRTATDGNKRARAIQGNERCAAASFVRGRAQLAATLTCANIAELRRESNSLRKDQHNSQERLVRQPASIVAAFSTT